MGAAETSWKRGKIEHHGDFIRDMSDRMSKNTTKLDIDDAYEMSSSAKNAMHVVEGYSPAQWVVAKTPSVPESILEEVPNISLLDAASKDRDFQKIISLRAAAR